MDEHRDVSSIKDVVNKVITALSAGEEKKQRIGEEEINDLWKRAAGGLASRRSRPTSLKKGKLIVAVGDSSLLYNLTLRKKDVLKTLNEGSCGRIREIQFRIGEASGERKSKDRKTKT